MIAAESLAANQQSRETHPQKYQRTIKFRKYGRGGEQHDQITRKGHPRQKQGVIASPGGTAKAAGQYDSQIGP